MKFATQRLAIALLFIGCFVSVSTAQLDIDLTVDITKSDDLFEYVYTLINTDFSFQSVNTFLLTTGQGAVLDEITAPDDWIADYAAAERIQQVTYLTGISDDEERCGATDEFDVMPGNSATFTIVSPWGPEPQEFSIGRLIETDLFPCDFEGESVIGQIESPSIPSDPVDFEPCDFDQDQDCDSKDINDLASAIALGQNEPKYDLTDDEFVNLNDLDEFLDQVSRFNGDADFNGKVEFADFLVTSGHFGLAELNWTEGDFDADGKVAFGDFLILSGNFGKGEVAAASLAAVPEPSAVILLASSIFGIAMLRRRRN